MTKRKYKTFPLNDLTGWINLRDYASEIEDKQMLQLENFDFEWNKLVSSKWIDRFYNSTANNFIQWMTVDGDDVWHIENANLWKNWEKETLNNTYTLVVEDINSNWFDIQIDWNKYVWDWVYWNEWTAYDALTSDLATLLWASYSVVKDPSNTFINIHKLDWTAISFVHPDLIKQINVDSWGTWSSMDITIDWTNITTDEATTPTLSWLYSFIVAALPWSTYTTKDEWIITLYRDDLIAPVITTNTITNYDYTVRAWDIDNPSCINLWGTDSKDANCSYVKEIIDWWVYNYTYPNGVYFPTYSFNLLIPHHGTVSHSSADSCFTIPYGQLYNDVSGWVFWYVMIDTATFYNAWTWTSNWYTFKFRNWDWSSITHSSERQMVYDTSLNTVIQTNQGDNNSWITNAHTSTFSVVSNYSELAVNWTTTHTTLDLIDDDFYDITVSSLWTLIVSKRGFAPVFIDTDWLSSPITSATVWEPTIGTIYQWKIILGWYSWTDNIYFSKSYLPDTPTNEYLDFSWYDAWSQSVSGWNKWVITWMSVWENGLYIFKEDSVWYTNSDKDTTTTYNFVFNKITSNGAVNQWCISEVEQEIFYFDYKNKAVRRLWYEQNLTTLRDVAISREIELLLEEIPENDEWNDVRTKTLLSTSYIYPHFDIHLTTNTSSDFFLSGVDEQFKYKMPNKTLSYNVDNKSWTVRTDKDDLGVLHAFKWVIGTYEWDMYNDHIWNTLEDWIALSKEYTFKDDVDWKAYWEIELVWDIVPDGTKVLTLEVLVDWELIELENSATPTIITLSETTFKRIKNRLELYDAWQVFQFRIRHSWTWKVVISDVYIKWRPDLGHEEYY